MNKYLVLLCFTLLFSNSFCTDCTLENACNYQGIEDADKDHYACVEDNGSCALKLKCIHAANTGNSGDLKCSDYYAETEGKTCIENPATEPESVCIEEYKCTKVQRPEGTTNW